MCARFAGYADEGVDVAAQSELERVVAYCTAGAVDDEGNGFGGWEPGFGEPQLGVEAAGGC